MNLEEKIDIMIWEQLLSKMKIQGDNESRGLDKIAKISCFLDSLRSAQLFQFSLIRLSNERIVFFLLCKTITKERERRKYQRLYLNCFFFILSKLFILSLILISLFNVYYDKQIMLNNPFNMKNCLKIVGATSKFKHNNKFLSCKCSLTYPCSFFSSFLHILKQQVVASA